MNEFLKKAIAFDTSDELAEFKDLFVSNPNLIYLDGNSLGKLPKAAMEVSKEVVEQQWGNRLIRSWNEHWLDLPKQLASKIATIVGAHPDEIFVGDSTSLNLYKAIYAGLEYNSKKKKLITDALNFPTDLYVAEGILKQHFKNNSLEIIPSEDGITTNIDALKSAMKDDCALVTLSHVVYKSGFKYPMKELNDAAQKNDALVVWDLSHAVGSVPVNLNENNAQLAVGCTYKYLNGGPGAPAFLYVSRDLQKKLTSPIWSWFGHLNPFDFSDNFQPDPGIQKFAVGTPHIISLAFMQPGLDCTIKAGIDSLRAKSVLQSEFFISLIQEYLEPLGFKIATPLNVHERGSHISLQHKEGYRINRALIEPVNDEVVIIPDFRPPNNIRLGIAPLYNSFEDIYQAVRRLEAIVQNEEYLRFGSERLTVT